MITLTIQFLIFKEFIEEFSKLSNTLQENTQKEEGCISYQITRFEDKPGTFLFSESFEDSNAIEIHKSFDYFKEWKEKTAHMIFDRSFI